MRTTLDPEFQARMAAAMATRKAKAKGKPAPKSYVAPLPKVEPPTEEPKIYNVLNMVLAKRVTYFIPISAPHLCDGQLRKITHFAVLRMAGDKLQNTRHEFSLWEMPTDGSAKIVSDVMDTPPKFSLITKPFIFHMKDEAYSEVKRILSIQMAD